MSEEAILLVSREHSCVRYSVQIARQNAAAVGDVWRMQQQSQWLHQAEHALE